MSTIKATHIQHPSAASPNFTLASDGTVSGGAGLGGLVHIHTETFASVSSVSIDDVFDATYNNYRVIVKFYWDTNSNSFIYGRFGGSDVGTSSNSYHFNSFNTTMGTSYFNSSSYIFNRANGNGNDVGLYFFDIFEPFDTNRRTLAWGSYFNNNTIGDMYSFSNTEFDGFRFAVDAGTATGVISVYGYANS